MSPRRATFSGLTLLAAAVLVLLPALAWLQYSWLEQIADADRERRARTLQTAATQLTQDFDAELGRAVFALQLDPALVEGRNWPAFAQNYQVWAASAASPRIVKSIYFVEAFDAKAGGTSAPPLRVWNTETHTFDEIPWPDDLSGIRTRVVHENVTIIDLPLSGERGSPGGARTARLPLQRMLMPPATTGDDQSVVTPVLRITPPASDLPDRRPEVKLLGFTIVRFDLAALGADLLPAVLRKHFYDDDGETEFAIAVARRDNPTEIVFESQPGAAAMASANPDLTTTLLGPRMGQFMFMARAGEGRRVLGSTPPPLPPPADPSIKNDVVVNVIEKREGGVSVQRAAVAADGQWQLMVKHRAGSLEAAVAATRTRNFALSSGIVALLAAAIGLIVVSARRADRLARQQLEFVAAVSHELRTPVSVIGAAAGNLADGVVDEPGRVKRYGVTIQTEARRLGETVERVLQLAGMAAGRAFATHAPVEVPSLIDDAVAATRHEQEAGGVNVIVEIGDEVRLGAGDAGTVRVVGDAAALRSAVQNLVSNAIKYSGDARWVRVSAAAVEDKRVRIAVEDRGLGIAADDRKHVFEPFYRGREAVARQIQGSGLGLHLVRRIVEVHGGTVAVQSEPGRGSTFTIELPILHLHDVIVPKSVSFVRRLARLT